MKVVLLGQFIKYNRNLVLFVHPKLQMQLELNVKPVQSFNSLIIQLKNVKIVPTHRSIILFQKLVSVLLSYPTLIKLADNAHSCKYLIHQQNLVSIAQKEVFIIFLANLAVNALKINHCHLA